MSFNLSNLTLGEAISELADFLPDGKEAFRLNTACERLLARGKYRGFTAIANFVVQQDKIITLPPDLETLIGATLEDNPQEVRDLWYEFVPKKPGGGHRGDWLLSRDLGDGFVTFKEPSKPVSKILIFGMTGSSSVSGNIDFRVGKDQGALEDLRSVVYSFPSSMSPPVESIGEIPVTGGPSEIQIVNFNKPRTSFKITIKVEYEDETQETIGVFQPRDKKLSLRRYAIQDARVGDVIRAFCKRRFRKAEEDADFLAVDSTYALRMALEAINYEESGDPDQAAKYWALGIKHLDDVLSEHRGSAMRTVPTFCRASAGSKLRALR